VRHFDNQVEEAEASCRSIDRWVAEGVPPSDIAILVRPQHKQTTEALGEELHDRGIPHRNEHDSQDLAADVDRRQSSLSSTKPVTSPTSGSLPLARLARGRFAGGCRSG
jgi:hypothetical protein